MADSQLIDVRFIPKPQRHPLIFEALDALVTGRSLVITNDHNPIPLREQVAALYGDQFTWRYLAEGPDVFQLEFTRRAAAPDAWKRADASSTKTIAAPVRVDLGELAENATHGGPQWGHECDDLDLTLLSWERGKCIDSHVNDEVDVVLIGVEGNGMVTINGETHPLRAGVALLIPKGCERAIETLSERFAYLSVHRRRRGLMPVSRLKPVQNSS